MITYIMLLTFSIFMRIEDWMNANNDKICQLDNVTTEVK